jgi:hypothetical protein
MRVWVDARHGPTYGMTLAWLDMDSVDSNSLPFDASGVWQPANYVNDSTTGRASVVTDVDIDGFLKACLDHLQRK